MSKVTGSYESVVRGVSEQVAQDRRSGQHAAQTNLISDPVRGLARRHGSVMLDEQTVSPYTAELYDKWLSDTVNHKVLSFFVAGLEYDLIYRSTDDGGLGRPSFAWCFDKANSAFIPMVYAPFDTVLDQLVTGGVSASVNVGKYVFLAGNSILPSATYVEAWGNSANASKFAAWVRGGAYSRTYSLKLTRLDGTTVTGVYTTVAASYPTLLDTTDILTADPDYQKKVNDRTNAHNSAVTAWIGTAAHDITPANIATQIAASLVAQGVAGVSVVSSTVCVNNWSYQQATADDGGDDTLFRAVDNEVAAADLVSTVHWVGKVVKVKPPSATDETSFYLQAYPKSAADTGFAPVTWREATGYVMTPQNVLVMATVTGGVMYLSSSAAGLAAIAGGTHPTYRANLVGDDLSCPLPQFFGRRIDYLGMFQDRLIIGAGAVLTMSRPGDYFNWFRQSVLTVIANDPWEGYAIGAEEDTIRYSTTYDRNLLLYGDRFQYTISGRTAFDARTGSIVTYTAYKDAAKIAPQSSGNLVFYARYHGRPGEEVTSLHQVQPGIIADSPESYNTGQALDRFISGAPIQILAQTAPNFVFLRTDLQRQRLYVYTYIDTAQGGERVFDAWSDWTWHPVVGDVVGMAHDGSDLVVYLLRHGIDVYGVNMTWIAAERFVTDTNLSLYPYADSLRPVSRYATTTADTFINPSSTFLDDACVAFADTSLYRFVGAPMTGYAPFIAGYPTEVAAAWVGVSYPAFVTPTNPYMRDRNDNTISTGRLTLSRVAVGVADTGGLNIDIKTVQGTVRTTAFSGRVLGHSSSLIGQQPIVTATVSGAIGKETRECSYTLSAKNWLPLTITSIDWVGQSFNNARRV